MVGFIAPFDEKVFSKDQEIMKKAKRLKELMNVIQEVRMTAIWTTDIAE
jgi:muramoyltetrapeptide carboxypeptidase LdcA involved in peptidoglycan recycling